MDFLINFFTFDFSFLERAGNDPMSAMWFLFLHGGFIPFLVFFGWVWYTLWLGNRQDRYNAAKTWMILSIRIPRTTEQAPRAVENIFAHLAGAHQPPSWTEANIIGRTQDTISLEIVSTEGFVQFFIRSTVGFKDLIEASIFAQYPDAEITQVEDYMSFAPNTYPDPEWDMFGTEMVPVKPEIYPIRTYPEFEDRVSGEFKDPLAVLLENLSRLGPGEHAWYQIVLTPIDQKQFRADGENLVKKLTGQPIAAAKKPLWAQIIGFPFEIIADILKFAGLLPPDKPAEKKADNPFGSKIMNMTPGERRVVEAIEMKISKIAYKAKIRILYIAKKEVFKKSRIVQPFIGAIKQFNTNDMQSLKPESKHVGMNGALWWFKDRRNDVRKTHFIAAVKKRSNYFGTPNFTLNIEELASLWHFPHSMQVKAPQLHKTQAKTAEPPMNLPFE